MTQRIIGFAGVKGAGKDTAADVLGWDCFVGMHFAQPIKDALNAIFGWSTYDWGIREWKEAPRPEAGGRSPRYCAETLGTEWGRELISPTLWVDITMARVRASNADVTLRDVRFPEEVQAIRNAGGYTIGIARPGFEPGSHASDQGFEHLDVDVVIANDGTVAELHDMVRREVRLLYNESLNDD